jgi:O-antigen ligase
MLFLGLRWHQLDKSVKFGIRLYFLLMILILVTGLIGIDAFYSIRRLGEFLSCLFYSIIIYNYLANREDALSFFYGALLASLIFAIYTLYSCADWSKFVLSFGDHDNDNFTGKNMTAFNLYFGMFISAILNYKNIKLNWLWFIVSMLLYLVIWMTFSMKVILVATPFELLIIRTCSLNYRFRFLVVVIAALFLLIYFWPQIIASIESGPFSVPVSRILIFLGLRAYAPLNYLQIAVHREELIASSIDIFIDHPLFGIGLENSRLLLGTYSHNTYLELAAGTGIFGLLIYIYIILRNIYRLWVSTSSKIKYIFIYYILSCSLLVANAMKLYSSHLFIILLILSPYILKLISYNAENENSVRIS